jgi:hypothetical protein
MTKNPKFSLLKKNKILLEGLYVGFSSYRGSLQLPKENIQRFKNVKFPHFSCFDPDPQTLLDPDPKLWHIYTVPTF